MSQAVLRLVLGGDLMLGRGIDQVMPRHCSPELQEPLVRDARYYVRAAEQRHGVIAPPFDPARCWGDALPWIRSSGAQLHIVNLETAITTSDQPCSSKCVHYRMHPANVASLQSAGIDACSLANNHVLDWGLNGLSETLRSLRLAGIATAGAGLSSQQAWTPARLPLPGGGGLLLFAWAFSSSGVPPSWAARSNRPGIALFNRIDRGTVQSMCCWINRQRRPGDRVMVSLHWGANWVAEIPSQHRWLAQNLIDRAGVDVVFGHSSHHPLPPELHSGRLILFGSGDLINDYEGLTAHAPWRSDLVCLYRLDLDRASGALARLVIHPYRLRGFQLREAAATERQFLARQLRLDQPPVGWHWREAGDTFQLQPAEPGLAA